MNTKGLWLTMVLFVALFSNLFAFIVPDAERVQWQNAGLYRTSPIVANNVFQINLMPGADWDEKIVAALDAAKAYINADTSRWAIIHFPQGTYDLHQTITLTPNHKKIIFQGESATLKFNFNSSIPNCFEVKGYETTPQKALASTLYKGSLSVSCTENIGYSQNTWIRIIDTNHPVNPGDEDWAFRYIGQINRLNSCTAPREY